MFSIIDRYLLRETLKGLLAILTVLLLVLVGHAFVNNLQRVAAGTLASDVILELLSLEVLRVLGVLLPAAFFFSILYTLGRMYRDNEMTALASCGIGTLRIYRSLLYFVLPVTAMVAWLTFMGRPWANQAIEAIKHEQEAVANIAGAAAGRFNEFSKGDLVFYAEDLLLDKRMHNIFIQNHQHGKIGLITANEGYQYVDEKTGDRFVVLTHGHRYDGLPGRSDYRVTEFNKYAVRISQEIKKPVSLRSKARSTALLWASDNMRDQSEFQYRLAFPLAVVLFTLISIPLSRSAPRQGIYGRMFLAFLIYFTFFNLLSVSGTWMKSGITPAWMGRWWVHLFVLCMVVPLILRDCRWITSIKRRLL